MAKISIELIYALPSEQKLQVILMDEPVTIIEAINYSGILKKYPDIDLSKNKVGLFSQVAQLNELLRDGDRIEIYRPLIADPKEARKKKAAIQKKK